MSDDYKRPDPDQLLHSIKAGEEDNKKGKLKIFFGMAAGVGKTYAMLEAARRMKNEGADVVAGYVETHGRSETEALLQGLEVMPVKTVEYNSLKVAEFDIDGLLARKPALVLIDELAHTNASPSRHTKRYLDVLEVIDNGIDVFSTLNVQHLESQVDLVEKITGVKIRETLPDSILNYADEIELVDIPPEELIKRLSEGKVYMPDRAAVAVKRFFRKGNLSALRELALRCVARIVDTEVTGYLRENNINAAGTN